jgi:hypothetical protein
MKVMSEGPHTQLLPITTIGTPMRVKMMKELPTSNNFSIFNEKLLKFLDTEKIIWQKARMNVYGR